MLRIIFKFSQKGGLVSYNNSDIVNIVLVSKFVVVSSNRILENYCKTEINRKTTKKSIKIACS